MRMKLRYGAAVGSLAAALGILGPMSAQAGQTPGTPVPMPAGAGSVSVQPPAAHLLAVSGNSVSAQAPAAHLLAVNGKSVVLSPIFERPAWQHETGIAQREDNNAGNAQERLGLPGQQNRVLAQNYPCYCGYCGYDSYKYRYHCCPYGIRDHDHSWGWGQCCGYPYPYSQGGGYSQGGHNQGGGYNNSYYYRCCRSYSHHYGWGRGTGDCYPYPTPYGSQQGSQQGDQQGGQQGHM